MAKPSQLPQWGDGAAPADIVDPGSAKRALGWSTSERPPHTYFNWWMNLVFQWIQWLDGFLGVVHTWTARQTLDGGCTVPASTPASSDAARRSEVDSAITTEQTARSTGDSTNASAITAGDAATLASANAHTDGAIAGTPIGSGSCGSYGFQTSFQDITNLSVTLATHGRSVLLCVQSSGVGASEQAAISPPMADTLFLILRDGTEIGRYSCNAVSVTPVQWLLGNITHIDVTPSAASHTYKLQGKSSAGGSAWGLKLVAVEL